MSNGVRTTMAFQATTKVQKPLASASRIAAKGNRIVLDGPDCLSYIENKATGVKIPLKIENGVYTMEVSVSSPPSPASSESAPFQRPAK